MASPESEMAELERQGTRNETIGFLGGAVVGGLIAGPPGAIGAAMLGLLSSSSNSEQNEKQLLASHLDQSQQELIALQVEQRDLERRYQLALQEIEATNLQRVSLTNQVADMQDSIECCSDTALSLHFQTNSAQIEQHYIPALEELSRTAESIDNPMIMINGFADARGSSADNQRLSEQRVDAVVRRLLALGISPEHIQANAFGESRTIGQSEQLETLFFDRRVNVELRSVNNELFTLSE
jgi:outer membrane protein OmpA-like peptidoglycan-associated protein